MAVYKTKIRRWQINAEKISPSSNEIAMILCLFSWFFNKSMKLFIFLVFKETTNTNHIGQVSFELVLLQIKLCYVTKK